MSDHVRSLFAALVVFVALPLFGGARDVFPESKHERIDYWVAEFRTDKDYHKKIAEGFERKAKYQEMLERKLRKRGMPQNLIYLAFEESAFNPVARSGQRAVGIWQLMPATR